jgi:hypothetical protein
MLRVMNESPVVLAQRSWHFYYGDGVIASTAEGAWYKVVAKDQATLDSFVERIQAV